MLSPAVGIQRDEVSGTRPATDGVPGESEAEPPQPATASDNATAQ
jgi:hypothetical protein